MNKAVIIDADLGFAFWLARGFDGAGYETYPARSVMDASLLLEELKITVDLLVFNPELPDAAAFVESVRRTNGSAKVVSLVGGAQQSSGFTAGVDLFCRRPDRTNDFKRQEWIEHLEELLPVNVLCGFAGKFRLPLPARPIEIAPVVCEGKQWQGQTIDGIFPLRQWLGGDADSAVFLTEYGDSVLRPAAIKLMPSGADHGEAVLARWERAAEVFHPGLIRLFGTGSCELDGIGLVYVVMEYAEENLGQVLVQRSLEQDEVRAMLDPVVETLASLHGQGLVQGGIKPSKILVVDDQVKLASIGICAGSPADDLRSLGLTVVEALTQQRSARVPKEVPAELAEIAHRCLRSSHRRPMTAADLQKQLQAPSAPEPRGASGPWAAFSKWYYAASAGVLALALSGILVRPRQVAKVAPAAIAEPVPPLPPPPHARRPLAQVVPEVAEEARETLIGTLRVSVRTHVDGAGHVVTANLESPGPSRYFAKVALEAARRWTFEPLTKPGQEGSGDWILNFEYTRKSTNVSAMPVDR